MRRLVIERDIPKAGSLERTETCGHPADMIAESPVLPKLYSRVAGLLAAWAWRAGDTLLLWRERRRQRQAVGALSDHMLKDLGLSRADTVREGGKRFWEA